MKASLLNHPFSIIKGLRYKKLSGCQVSLPPLYSLCLCAMLAHSGGLSVSPWKSDLWPALACLWDATVPQKKAPSFHGYSARMGVAMQHWGGTDREGMELRCPVAETACWRSPKYWGLYYTLTPSTKSVGRQRKRAICWVTAVTCEHRSRRVKRTPSPPDF